MANGADAVKGRLVNRVRELAYLYSPESPFTLASGRLSPHFFDMKPVMMDPECAHMIGVMIHEILDEIGGVDAVGGLELGAVPLTGIVIAKSSKEVICGVSLFERKSKAEEVEKPETRLVSKVRL